VNIKEAVISALKELIIPELASIKNENKEIKALLSLTNNRLDDHNAHLVDLSRRIDEINKRIDETNKRIDETNKRIDETNKRIDELRVELKEEIATNTIRIDGTNERIDRLYEVIVKKDEHVNLVTRVAQLEHKLKEIEMRIAP